MHIPNCERPLEKFERPKSVTQKHFAQPIHLHLPCRRSQPASSITQRAWLSQDTEQSSSSKRSISTRTAACSRNSHDGLFTTSWYSQPRNLWGWYWTNRC